ncbi:MAG: hypothetical protein HY343_02580, partial [Lentisphaerae bacterium]|nr:hypothetical protein [Lentisphaerota bacterium]
RAARERLDYTECHLGMADYGPQFQREVLLNHPADLHGFELSRFSSDWATFLGFRHSRAEWQQRYQNLMPESGLYYYVTHYANWGHPRRYTDPEPHLLLYGPSAYCGLAYNFHDAYGFRDAVAAAAAFSPYYVFGHLELRMPERDVAFARAYLQWVADNADVLRRGRVCMEDDVGCVVSKLRAGRGVLFVLNYGPAERIFRLTLRTGSEQALTVRQVYPLRRDGVPFRDGETLEAKLRGESCAILEFGRELKTLPPENPDGFSLELGGWEKRADECIAHIAVPSLNGLSARAGTPDLPKELLCLDQAPTSAPALADRAAPEAGEEPVPVGQWLGRGPLPDLFLRAYDIREEGRVETWKLAPWAFADRLWLVYCPARPLLLGGPLPAARVNGRSVTLAPRIDYRRGKPGEWMCPLFYADVTGACRPGEDNTVSLSGIGEAVPAGVRIVSQAEQPMNLTDLKTGASDGCPHTMRLLREGREPVRIVCFGDSITGVYYHSGGARAWCDLVGIGLRRLYPNARIELINAGISSQTSANGLARIQRDVLDRKPALVVVAFGMNDVRGSNPLPVRQAHDNQMRIVTLCKGAGAEVVLCTPTSIYHGYAEWPFERLAPYADTVRQVAAEAAVPVADSYRAFEGIRGKNPVAWMLLMSEWIHPNMNGHKVIAQEVIRAVTGADVSLADVPAPVPGIPFTLSKLVKGERVKVLAMEPYDTMIAAALRAINPSAQPDVTPWPVPHRSLAEIERSAMGVRDQAPDLVVVAIPAAAGAPTEEWFIRHTSDIYNYSISYGTRQFDCIGVLPSVLTPSLGPAERRGEALTREIIKGHDLDPVERSAGDTATPEQLVTRWVCQQARSARQARVS